jgi:hypothetical protein
MKKESLYRGLTIATPIMAVVFAAGGSIFEWQRLGRFERETTVTQAKLTQIDRELRSYEAQPQTQKFPTVAKTPREQALFLDALRANADVCKVQLVRWSNSTPGPAAPAPDKSATALPAGVSAIVSTVEVVGRSESTRQFLYNVVKSRRLLNMSDLKWVRDTWPNTHLTFTLTRYVAPPVQLPAGHRPLEPAGADRNSSASSGPGAAPEITPAPERSSNLERVGGMEIPNPMDAPGIAHRSYQTRLEANVSKLSELDQAKSSESPHPPAVTNAKH